MPAVEAVLTKCPKPCLRNTGNGCGDAGKNTFDIDVDHVFPVLHAQVVQGGDRPNARVVEEKLAVARFLIASLP